MFIRIFDANERDAVSSASRRSRIRESMSFSSSASSVLCDRAIVTF